MGIVDVVPHRFLCSPKTATQLYSMRRTSALALSFIAGAAILIISATSTAAFAQAGSLDPDFATAGIGSYFPGSEHSRSYDIIALADNSMLLCGYSYANGQQSAGVAHILENGAIDPSFGESSGYTLLSDGNLTAYTMALAPDQSIYLAGFSNSPFTIFLAHLSAAGIRDAAFGTNGIEFTPLATGQGTCSDMVIQPDGRIVVVGTAYDADAPLNSRSLFIRYLPNGTLDTDFNNTGILLVDGSPENEGMQGVALMDDGSIVAAGYDQTGSTLHNQLMMLNADGTMDLSFGTGGITEPSLGGTAEGAYDVLVNQGSIYVVGNTTLGDNTNGYLAKFNADGTLDTSFGTGGSTISDFGGIDFLHDLAIQPDGKIVACGNTGNYETVITVRYGTDGALDATFGDAGMSINDLSSGDDELYGIAVQPDGKIVAAGFTHESSASTIVLRYLNDLGTNVVEVATYGNNVALAPNPVSGNLTILQLTGIQEAQVWISDLHGHVIAAAFHVPKGVTSATVHVNDIPTGVYLVNVLSDGITTRLKLQVSK